MSGIVTISVIDYSSVGKASWITVTDHNYQPPNSTEVADTFKHSNQVEYGASKLSQQQHFAFHVP